MKQLAHAHRWQPVHADALLATNLALILSFVAGYWWSRPLDVTTSPASYVPIVLGGVAFVLETASGMTWGSAPTNPILGFAAMIVLILAVGRLRPASGSGGSLAAAALGLAVPAVVAILASVWFVGLFEVVAGYVVVGLVFALGVGPLWCWRERLPQDRLRRESAPFAAAAVYAPLAGYAALWMGIGVIGDDVAASTGGLFPIALSLQFLVGLGLLAMAGVPNRLQTENH